MTAPPVAGMNDREIQEQEAKRILAKQRDQCCHCCGVLFFPLRVLLGCLAFTFGFCINSFVDACTGQGKTSEWKEIKDAVSKFLVESGLSEELKGGWNDRAISNMRQVNAIQRKLFPHGRANACMMENPPEVNFIKASRIMKFATAAYGPQAIANAVFETGERVPPGPQAKVRDAVMEHIGVPGEPENIIVMDLDYGEDLEYLRHYCVVDHKHKAIVLAIRGTYSLSATMADCAGYCEDFCGGKAHVGMTKMVRGIWNKSGTKIVEAIRELPREYEFVICGHSLGSGVAGLVNILVHHEEVLTSWTNIECYLFGGPPTFSKLQDVDGNLLEAAKHSHCFVHQRDIVPFLSADAIRSFIGLLAAVDQLEIPLCKKVLIDHEVMEPSEAVLNAYRQAETQEFPVVDKAPPLYIPAKCITWIEREPSNGICKNQTYKATFCDPEKVRQMGPLVTPGGIADHLLGRYELSLANAHL